MIDKGIKDLKDCMGCHSCMNICPVSCISMVSDIEGFLYPEVDNNLCVRCNKCVNVCPIINKRIIANTPNAYACINRDEGIRLDSSSGGIFTLIAEKIISEAGVVFGAMFNNEFELVHQYVDKIEDLSKLRGSKYVQSKINNAYKLAQNFLNSGRTVLFTGTPCQIAGLYSYLPRTYSNLLTIDFICHGVPSPRLWRKYIRFREDKADIDKINFRRKNNGWKQFSVSFIFKDNTEYRKIFKKDLYMRAFLRDICLRPSCYRCEFKTLNRQSDFTLGDFWGVGNILPEMDDDKGTSLVLVNSVEGNKIFDFLTPRMIFVKVNMDEAIKYNSPAIKSVPQNPKRQQFFNDLEIFEFDKLVNTYCTDKLINILIAKGKSFVKKIFFKTKY